MVARSPNSERKMVDNLPDVNVAAEFYARYDIREVLGKGVSSTVRRCIEKSTGRQYAVKIFEMTDNDRPDDDPASMMVEEELEELRKSTMKEVDILNVCAGQPHIIELHDTFVNNACIFLVFELCRRGELFDYLTEVVTLNETRTRQIMRQILEAVCFMHSVGVVHRDLKLENILLDDNFTAKLSDFGFAARINTDSQLTDLCGTPGYLAPELLRVNMYEKAPGYGRPVDMWCCGVIMYTLLCGFQPFWHNTKMETVMAILNGNYSFDTPEWQDLSVPSKDLISKLLAQDAHLRLTAAEALRHPFIRQDDSCMLSPRIIIDEVRNYPLRRFKSAVFAVVAVRRFTISRQVSTQRTMQHVHISRLSAEPYGVRAFRRAIDAGAFRIYHHWVKKGDAENRGALFEMEPRRDIKRASLLSVTSPRR